jgi:hypothetical protein
MQHTKAVLRKSAIVATLALGLVGAGAGAAFASTPVHGPNPPTGPSHPITHPAPPPPPRPVAVSDSGRIVMVNARTISVRGNNGRITVFGLTPRTTILKNGRPTMATRLAPQDRVQVTGVRTGTVDTANRVVDTGR